MTPEAVIAQVFGFDPNEVGPDTLRSDIPDWDSLAHVSLVLELERAFGVELSTDDALAIDGVASAKRVLAERGARW